VQDRAVQSPPELDAWVARGLRCSNCSAPVELDERRAVLVCRHCGQESVLDRAEAVIWHDLDAETPSPGRQRGSRPDEAGPEAVSCAHCGAVMVRTRGALTSQCHYCLSSLAVEASEVDVEAFDGIVPFSISGQEAREKFAGWLGDAWFAPGDLTRAAKVEELDSIYVPCHFWRTQARTEWRARVGILTTAAEDLAAGYQRKAGDPGHVRTRWEDQTGTIEEPALELESASRVVLTKQLQELGGFDGGHVVAYHRGFLGRRDAELPVLDRKESFARMLARLERSRADRAESQITAERHKDFRATTTTEDTKVRLALVPVYLVAYRYKGEVFRVLVHGVTGNVCGDHPLSPWKIGCLLTMVAAVGLALLVALN
jgi:hypothetical protein